MPLPYATYLGHIRTESARFREALTGCTPDARVPSAPEWTAADLLWHLGEVQHWWHHCITHRPAPPDDYVEPERPAAYDALFGFYDEWHTRFIEALSSASPEDEAWSWSANPSHHTVGFTYRRQAHEAAIHRLDAELAAGSITPLDPELALDGVEECLGVMYGGLPPWGSFDPLPHHVEFRASDRGRSVWVQLGLFSGTPPQGDPVAGEPDFHVVPDPGQPADATVAGTADDLDAWLWHRRGDEVVHVTGELEVYDRVRAVLKQPIK